MRVEEETAKKRLTFDNVNFKNPHLQPGTCLWIVSNFILPPDRKAHSGYINVWIFGQQGHYLSLECIGRVNNVQPILYDGKNEIDMSCLLHKASYHIGSPISFLFTNCTIDFYELAPHLPSLVRSILALMQVNAN